MERARKFECTAPAASGGNSSNTRMSNSPMLGTRRLSLVSRMPEMKKVMVLDLPPRT